MWYGAQSLHALLECNMPRYVSIVAPVSLLAELLSLPTKIAALITYMDLHS